ncbi:hypothetical protein AB9K26_08715 [Psychroserpens sp. XS_ASV72]|uniref:hypothetical protein n=1 Tax=Psychroserpens sp. XS_ASV72 TaxID=3241293 RepID=UPI0035133280
MKLIPLTFILALFFTSCKDKTTETVASPVNYSETELDITTSIYPESISKVFEAHGGLDTWKKMRTLKFTMSKPSGDEVTLTDLYERYSLITMPEHTIGFDGEKVWLQNKDTTNYKGNAKFYHNLMFYFYAMPFVLADDGIVYEESEPLNFDGTSYPGIKISYESGVGESPEDEYIIYYHPVTHKMVWLGYTVTYFTNEKSKEFHFINYSDWQTVNRLQLPKTLSWYNYENNKPTTKRNEVEFVDVLLSEEKPDAKLFQKPDSAQIVE